MTDDRFMSQGVWVVHNAEIIAAVKALLLDPVSRRRFELAAIYTAKRSELLARILRTNFGIVAVADSWVPAGASERRENGTQRNAGLNYFRSTEATMVLWPLTGKLDAELLLTSRSRREPYIVIEEDILRRIERRPYEDGREFRHHKSLVFG